MSVEQYTKVVVTCDLCGETHVRTDCNKVQLMQDLGGLGWVHVTLPQLGHPNNSGLEAGIVCSRCKSKVKDFFKEDNND